MSDRTSPHPPAHHPYAPIIASAMRRPELWRAGLSIVGIILIGLILTPVLFALISHFAPNLAPFQFGARGLAVGATPGGMFTILSGFLLVAFGTIWMARRLHARSLRDITGPGALMRAQFVTTLKWIVGFTALIFFLPWDGDTEVVANLEPRTWLFWLPFALLGLMIQVTAEELFFRGYLQSQIAGSTGSYPLGLAASAVLFGLAHMNGSLEGVAAFFPVIWAMGFGLLAGDLTMRSGTIGPAIALHLVNNVSPILLAAQQDMMSGFALFVQTEEPSVLLADPKVMVFQTLLLITSWLVARLAIRR
ncbi:CPBP family intramembrane glutamic endopeptidase [Celeribacter sp. PS-C1]|uniref:CPBP family intramembrane glutamic endopeptidase n=1 Tax=Celeribacter sp. PS-C1 TaxID=2820813 RepID=UPI001C66A2FD|nr:type II CAAX endopeptidase family protein [Celeribacter sp. PS-C1]MBW6416486.1 CPBP family intramembrane metalloprotease [Celeribacter sp. PS-C1]